MRYDQELRGKTKDKLFWKLDFNIFKSQLSSFLFSRKDSMEKTKKYPVRISIKLLKIVLGIDWNT
jgi:hypothetical protein